MLFNFCSFHFGWSECMQGGRGGGGGVPFFSWIARSGKAECPVLELFCVSLITIFNACDLPTLFQAPCPATARISARQHATECLCTASMLFAMSALHYHAYCMSCRCRRHARCVHAACYLGPRHAHSVSAISLRFAISATARCFILFIFPS
jgi:hypothetical protein